MSMYSLHHCYYFPVENGMTPDFNELQSPLQMDNSISSTNIYILYG